MNTNASRREFLKLSGAGALTASMFSCSTAPKPVEKAAAPPLPDIGIQLYTVRDAIAKDLPGTLKRVADTGYKFVELADYAKGKFYGKDPAEFKKMCDDLGLAILSSHTQVEGAGVTLENAKVMADDHLKLGVKYCFQPWIVEEMRKTIASYQRMAANWNKIGAVMKERGIQFGYHNHNFEFATVQGKVPYFDVMLAELDKDLVTMELDLFWTTKAGQNPVDIIKKYPGRFQFFHMKDSYGKGPQSFTTDDRSDIAPVGEGVIDFKGILAVKDIAGMKYMVVEQDVSRDNDIFGDIQKSITNLKTKILV